jgi:hypothetical protein
MWSEDDLSVLPGEVEGGASPGEELSCWDRPASSRSATSAKFSVRVSTAAMIIILGVNC